MESPRQHIRNLFFDYFTYNSPPVNIPALLNLFTSNSNFTAQYPSRTLTTPENYKSHVSKTAKLAKALFRKSSVFPDPSSAYGLDDEVQIDDEKGTGEALVDWIYYYTWRVIGVKGVMKGYNRFVFEREGIESDAYGGWRIKFVSTQKGREGR